MIKRLLINKFTLTFLFLMVINVFQVSLKYVEASSPEVVSILDDNFQVLKKNISNANWQELKKTLLEIKKKYPGIEVCEVEAPLRFLYGHSALATGENSVAVKQFYCSIDAKTDSKTIKKWLNWTRNLATHDEYSRWTISHYLHGDALARSGDFKAAKKELDKALEIDPKNVMALNARGVVNWLLYEALPNDNNDSYDLDASDDFINASKIDPLFADAFANRGVVSLRVQSGLNQANLLFEKATAIDSFYWLAANGKAVVSGATGKYWTFLRILDEIEKQAPNTPFLNINRNDFKNKRIDDLNSRGMTTLDTWQKLGRSGLEAMNMGGLANFVDIASTEIGRLMNNRGGIFLYVKEGENLKVTNDGSFREAWTWFALNYPQTHREDK